MSSGPNREPGHRSREDRRLNPGAPVSLRRQATSTSPTLPTRFPEEPMPASPIHGLLTTLASEILQASVDPRQSLVAQGLDSLAAEELLAAIRNHGYDADYGDLLDEASVDSLAASLRERSLDGPAPAPPEVATEPIPLTGPQVIWARLEQQGWGAWANLSVCVSMPASRLPAAFLPAIAQSLCEAHDAMRMGLVPPGSSEGVPLQRVIPDFQVPVRMREAPGLERDAMRLVEAFEGEEATPFAPSTRALVLASATNDGRHWLCLTMHHLFADRLSLHCLARQLRTMISKAELRVRQRPPIGYVDHAIWQHRLMDPAETQRARTRLKALLAGADVSPGRPRPALANEQALDLGTLPASSTLRPAEGAALGSLATRLETTLPLLLHALGSVLVTRLTGDEPAASGETDMLLCHVVSNRESHAALRDLVGCLDTSVPVAVRLAEGETLQSLCARTRHAFAETHRCVSSLPRGEWFGQAADDAGENRAIALFERVPHLNIIRVPPGDTHGEDAAGVRLHPVQRVQQTRWGLLIRVTLPSPGTTTADGGASGPSTPSGIQVSASSKGPRARA